MKASVRTPLNLLARTRNLAIASALATAGLFPLLTGVSSAAFGTVSSRSIEMSSAKPYVSGDPNVSYLVTFTPVTTATTIQNVVVDFCSNDPLIGDSCTAPSSFTVGTPTVSGISMAGEAGTAFTATSINSGRTLVLTSASNGATGTPSGAASFTLTTARNPDTLGSFYARIFTFSSNANETTWAATSNGSASATVLDAGGIALSTSNLIQLTAKVQETLTFCTASVTITSACANAAANPPTLTIGHASGTATILDSSAVNIVPAYTQLTTNAQTGAIVRMKATNTCSDGGMSSTGGAACSIQGVGSTAVVLTAGQTNGAFAACVAKGANTVLSATYNDTINNCPTGAFNATSKYGMNGANVTSTYGDAMFNTTAAGAVLNEANTIVFAATANVSTPAGTYTANESLIATGTF